MGFRNRLIRDLPLVDIQALAQMRVMSQGTAIAIIGQGQSERHRRIV